MTTRGIMLGLGIVVALVGCDKQAGGTKQPGDGDTGALERMEGPGGQPAAQAPSAEGKDKPKQDLPRVQDRDPEEEKRKMAKSRAKSAQAVKQLRAGQMDQAILQSRAALKIHEQNVEAMLVIAEAFYRQAKYELTLAVTNSILAVDPKVRTPQETGRTNNLRGFAHAAMGNGQAATQAFKKAAEADDKNAAAWNNLGTRYLDAGDSRTATSCFTYAIELKPGFAKAHLNMGAALRAQRKWKDAEQSLQKALQLKSNYPEAYFNLGLLYLDADPFPGLETKARLEKAISYLNKYKSLPVGSDPAAAAEASGRGRKVRGRPGAKPGPPPVSPQRADDYIRVAEKGIDREKRRIEREAKRKAKGAAAEDAPQTPGGSGADTAPADSGAAKSPAQPSSPAQTSPQKPGAQQPGKPQAPATPSKPAEPTPKPSPQPPAQPTTKQPQKPGAQKPGGQPSQKPQKPGAQKPGAQKPQKPGAQKPGAQQPQKPGAQKPGVQKPGPQKPGGGGRPPQRPGQKSASAGNPRVLPDTKAKGHASRGALLVVVDTEKAETLNWASALRDTP